MGRRHTVDEKLFSVKEVRMRKMIVILIGLALVTIGSVAYSQQWVNPYTRRDGTYVYGHWKGLPNEKKLPNEKVWPYYKKTTNPYRQDQSNGTQIKDGYGY